MQGVGGCSPGLQEFPQHRYHYKALSTFSFCLGRVLGQSGVRGSLCIWDTIAASDRASLSGPRSQGFIRMQWGAPGSPQEPHEGAVWSDLHSVWTMEASSGSQLGHC